MFSSVVIPPSSAGDCLIAEYYKEREDRHTLFHAVDGEPVGFASYKWVGPDDQKGCYIVDLYVKEAWRHKHIASKMADEISLLALEKGCRWLYGSVSHEANHHTESMKVLLSYGFKHTRNDGAMMYFKKDLEA